MLDEDRRKGVRKYLSVSGTSHDTGEGVVVYPSADIVVAAEFPHSFCGIEDGVDTFIECGPGKTLHGLARKTLKGATILRAGDMASLRETLDALGVE